MILLKTRIILMIIPLIISCAEMKVEKEGRLDGTLIVYLYSGSNQQDINFTVDGLEIKQKDGEWIKLSEKPLTIRSLDIANNQVLLTESAEGRGV